MEDIKSFPDLVYVSPRRWETMPTPYVIEFDSYFAGVCGVYEVGDWVKFGPLVILTKYQGQGLGKALFTEVLSRYSHKNVFIASSNRIVQKLALQTHFERVRSILGLPREIQILLLNQLLIIMDKKLILDLLRKHSTLQHKTLEYFVRRSLDAEV